MNLKPCLGAALLFLLLFVLGAAAETSNLPTVAAGPPAAAGTNQNHAVGSAPSNQLALGSPAIYQKSLAALTMLFVIAVLLENAFSVLFNWRVFLTYFSLTGVKTIVMVVASYLVVAGFEIDVVANLIAQYKPSEPPPDSGLFSRLVTALILAGGSSGVYQLMTALGFRDPSRPQEIAPQPPPNKAWVAIRVRRQQAVGPVLVKIQAKGPAAADPAAPVPLAGVMGASRPSLLELLLRNQNRFPQNGGHVMLPDTVYLISVEAVDKANNPLRALGGAYVFAAGAIVDLEVSL